MSGEPRLPEQADHGPQVGPGQVGAVLASLHFHTISRQFLIIQPAGYYIILLGVHDLAGVDVGQDVLQAGEESIAAGVPAETALEEGVVLVSTKYAERRIP